MAHNSDTPATGRSPETVYHPGPRILVTDRRIEAAGRRFPLRELTGFYRVEVGAHPARRVALIAGGLELALAVPPAVYFGAISLLCAGLVAGAGLAAAIAFDSRHNPRSMALLAVHRGQAVVLFSTRNREEFALVRLAVQRAAEACEDRWATGRAVMAAAAPTGRPGASRARRRPSGRR